MLLAAMLLAAVGPASANDVDDCFGKEGVEADAACTRAIALGRASGPMLAQIYNSRAINRHDLNALDDAVADYRQAIEIDPSFTAGYTGLALAYQRKGELGQAKDWYRKALSVSENYNDGRWAHAMARTQLAGILLVEGDLDGAIENYDEALRVEPTAGDAFETYMNRGLAWSVKGDLDRAIADHEAAIRLDPSFAPPYANRGFAWRAKGDPDRAIADCSEAIRLDPGYGFGYSCRGYGYFAKGEFPAAAADLQRAIERDDGAYAMLWRYLARAAMGEDGAAELAENAARLKTSGWPGPLFDFYLGRRSVDATLAAADKPAERCLTQFFLGQWYLVRSNRADAAAMLHAAADSCPRTFSEDHAAVPESRTFVEYYSVMGDLKRLRP
jgi:tetratricopeptide (TPR) repeat protein